MPHHLFRFSSLKRAPLEIRRLLRDKFDRKLRVHRHHHPSFLAADVEVVSDLLMLRLLQSLSITFEAEWDRAAAIYAAAANFSDTDPKDLRSLADAGWARMIWGRVFVARDLRNTARQDTFDQLLPLD